MTCEHQGDGVGVSNTEINEILRHADRLFRLARIKIGGVWVRPGENAVIQSGPEEKPQATDQTPTTGK